MARYTLREVAEAAGAVITGAGEGEVRELLTDSRRIADAEGALFVALHGPRHDGHAFIPAVHRQGVRYFLVDRPVEEGWPEEGVTYLQTEDTLRALQRLAGWHRSRYRGTVVAVTGSNGKTIVKEWLAQTLSSWTTVVRSPASYNSQVGVPLSLWLLDNVYRTAVIEAGISRPGEMRYLQRIVRPQVGILTNIGEAHQENFSSFEEKLFEKLELFREAEVLVLRDVPWLRGGVERFFAGGGPRRFVWGQGADAALRVTAVRKEGGRTHVTARFEGEEVTAVIPFLDDASFENAMHVWAAALALGMEPWEAATALQHLQPVAMRLEIKKGAGGTLLVNDYYNSDLQSLTIALQVLQQQDPHGRRTVILSDILQSGRPPGELYGDVARRLREHGVQRFIGVGPALSAHASLFPEGSLFFPGTEALLEALPTLSFRDETLLLKGARDFRLERVSRLLEEQVHETVLEVDLDALRENLNTYRSLLFPGTRIMAMVKAFAYGAGALEVARVLEYEQVDFLAVAYADEGVALRQGGIRLPVVVMNPERSAFDQIIRHSLEPEIYSMEMLEAFRVAVEKEGLQDYPIHIKLDTGMHRLGFMPEETEALLKVLRGCHSLYVRSVFSHLAASDDPSQDAFTHRQIALFREMAEKFEKRLGHRILKHILNSAGIERFSEAQFDMVRPGLGLYGVSPSLSQRLRAVASFRSVVIQVKEVGEGETVGYGRSFRASRPVRIAVVPVGYADGLRRNLSDGNGELWVAGQRAPIVGKICMDMCMVDVTGLDVRPGDPVEVFGRHIPLEEVARRSGTIPYEILAAIPSRVKRVYLKEG